MASWLGRGEWQGLSLRVDCSGPASCGGRLPNEKGRTKSVREVDEVVGVDVAWITRRWQVVDIVRRRRSNVGLNAAFAHVVEVIRMLAR